LKEAERIVGAAVDGKANFRNIIVGLRCRLRTSDRALVVGPTDVELVVIRAVWFQVLGFNLAWY
jgi:hypothetical protein